MTHWWHSLFMSASSTQPPLVRRQTCRQSLLHSKEWVNVQMTCGLTYLLVIIPKLSIFFLACSRYNQLQAQLQNCATPRLPELCCSGWRIISANTEPPRWVRVLWLARVKCQHILSDCQATWQHMTCLVVGWHLQASQSNILMIASLFESWTEDLSRVFSCLLPSACWERIWLLEQWKMDVWLLHWPFEEFQHNLDAQLRFHSASVRAQALLLTVLIPCYFNWYPDIKKSNGLNDSFHMYTNTVYTWRYSTLE